uniref:Uncharacterized protein n=1 Tax=Glossina palpalis gambiensis TaxID=67801 RepID=A0A1B0BE99_9MUSC
MVAIAINVHVVINEIHINVMIIVIAAVIELSFLLSQLMPIANSDVGRCDDGNNNGGDNSAVYYDSVGEFFTITIKLD